jgi:hypothetical protein
LEAYQIEFLPLISIEVVFVFVGVLRDVVPLLLRHIVVFQVLPRDTDPRLLGGEKASFAVETGAALPLFLHRFFWLVVY